MLVSWKYMNAGSGGPEKTKPAYHMVFANTHQRTPRTAHSNFSNTTPRSTFIDQDALDRCPCGIRGSFTHQLGQYD